MPDPSYTKLEGELWVDAVLHQNNKKTPISLCARVNKNDINKVSK